MKKLIIRFFFIFLFFNSIALSSITIIESNYEIFNVPTGKTDFLYKITLSKDYDSQTSPYIMMKFSEPIIICYNRVPIYYCPDDPDDYFDDPIYENYIALKLIDYIVDFNFSIISKNENPIEMCFIDSSKEINISFEQFINWKFDVQIYDDYIPVPMIFNVEQIQKTDIYLFNTNSKGTVVNDDNLLYYCVNDENGCNFKVLNILEIKKEKKYKFKLNPSSIKERFTLYYFFDPIELTENEIPENAFYLPFDRTVDFDFKYYDNIFKFYYFEENNIPAQLIFKFYGQANFYIISTDGINAEKKYYDKNKNNIIIFNLLKQANYYIKIIPLSSEQYNYYSYEFMAILRKCELIETIDLKKKIIIISNNFFLKKKFSPNII